MIIGSTRAERKCNLELLKRFEICTQQERYALKNYRLKIQRATKFECSKSRDKKVKGSNKPF